MRNVWSSEETSSQERRYRAWSSCTTHLESFAREAKSCSASKLLSFPFNRGTKSKEYVPRFLCHLTRKPRVYNSASIRESSAHSRVSISASNVRRSRKKASLFTISCAVLRIALTDLLNAVAKGIPSPAGNCSTCGSCGCTKLYAYAISHICSGRGTKSFNRYWSVVRFPVPDAPITQIL